MATEEDDRFRGGPPKMPLSGSPRINRKLTRRHG
jgi:hypothetical protein